MEDLLLCSMDMFVAWMMCCIDVFYELCVGS